MRELVEYAGEVSGHPRRIWGLGDGLSRLQGRILGRLPGQPYSYDNYLSATVDNVCTHNALPELGIEPTGIDTVVPQYLRLTRAERMRRGRTSAGATGNKSDADPTMDQR
ncbi:hypothetical protein [Alkalilimnicola ehrlichii]|uniref:hypothetical protein n=1 Tax=Alkalilimnicola ehrlichii TaxID=351052 RepID=UPI0026BF84DD|nr:hypothetical protein [Alkalilimnicola ehrlichii]